MLNTKHSSPYETGLDQCDANFVTLSPVSFLDRTAEIYPNRTAVIYGELRRNWDETRKRALRIASALKKRGFNSLDTVGVMLPNIPEMLELHFSIPMIGAVLNPINTRLDAEAVAFILDHGQAKVFFTDKEYSSVVSKALELCKSQPLIINIDDPKADGVLIGDLTYDHLLAEGQDDYEYELPDNEWHPIALNYTSGTTGNPKGVVYHHRGAYLNSMSNIIGQGLPQHAVYLWTLPMFHCNGWCYPWAVTAVAGTHVCLRQVRAKPIFQAFKDHQVTHFCGAPVVLNTLINAPEDEKVKIEHQITVTTGGAAPPAKVIEGMEGLGIQVIHAYGLTETYGPSVFCNPQEEWEMLNPEDKASKMARQGMRAPGVGGLKVIDVDSGKEVPKDGLSLGEVVIRSNTVMKGYLANPTATKEALAGGWFKSGDIAVMHPDGYIEVKDRSKDIIISGGENISTIEVEDILYRHPSVLEAAVVAKPDEKWGEVPCAVITLKDGEEVEEQEIINFCRDNMARFKCPKKIIFASIPKTATGKIQKFSLREMVRTHD